MTPPVTTITRNARSADDLTDADYRDIYSEVRTRMSLRAFIALIDSRYSPGWWSKYEHDQIELTRTARNELRRAAAIWARRFRTNIASATTCSRTMPVASCAYGSAPGISSPY